MTRFVQDHADVVLLLLLLLAPTLISTLLFSLSSAEPLRTMTLRRVRRPTPLCCYRKAESTTRWVRFFNGVGLSDDDRRDMDGRVSALTRRR